MTEPFTQAQIDEILKEIPLPVNPLPRIQEQCRAEVVEHLRGQLPLLKIYPGTFSFIKEKILHHVGKSYAIPGTPVGIISAQTIEKFTQGSLNLFHSAGLASTSENSAAGRMDELLNNTATPKYISFKLYMQGPPPALLIDLSLRDLVVSYGVYPFGNDGLTEEEVLLNTYLYGECPPMPFTIRMNLDLAKMYKYGIKIPQVASLLRSQIPFLFPMVSAEDKGILLLHVTTTAYPELFDHLRNYAMNHILDTKIGGIKGITSVFKKVEEGQVHYEGNGGLLEDLLLVPHCDRTRTITNNIREVESLFGIEAARSLLIEELGKLLGADNGNTNPIHTVVAIDNMVVTGKVHAINRHGIDFEEVGPISKFAFEEPVKNLFYAAMFGEEDNCKSVSATTYIRSRSTLGTGMMDALTKL